jgi:hypothetical protein
MPRLLFLLLSVISAAIRGETMIVTGFADLNLRWLKAIGLLALTFTTAGRKISISVRQFFRMII